MRRMIGLLILAPLLLSIVAPCDRPYLAAPRLSVSDDEKLDALMSAVEAMDSSGVRTALRGPPLDLNFHDAQGLTPLTRAARVGWAEGVRLLLDHGADVKVADDRGRTALYYTMYVPAPASVQMFDLLLRHGADVNATCEGGQTVLMCAAGCHQAQLLRRLISARADVNAAADNGFTALHAAAATANPEAIHLLLSAGANPDARDDEGRTPSEIARERESTAAASILSDRRSR